MKKVIILGITLMLMTAALVGCRKEVHEVSVGGSGGSLADYAKGQELLCLVASQEKAQEIADMYGIKLVSFTDGVATFHTEEDPMTVINMGKEKGYPDLELNHVTTLD